jgi:hypothetical protein
MLQQVYMPLRDGWTGENERQYQRLRLNEANFLAVGNSPDQHPELLRDISISEWTKAWKLYAQLRFARLCLYLRARQPDAMIGYSILIYRLDQAELDSAVSGDLRQFSSAIERALTPAPREKH